MIYLPKYECSLDFDKKKTQKIDDETARLTAEDARENLFFPIQDINTIVICETCGIIAGQEILVKGT